MTTRPSIRALLSAPGCTVLPGAAEVLSARIMEEQGFEAVYAGGNAIGLAHGKAQPFVSAVETADTISRIVRATGCAVLADVGAGFGEGAHLDQAIREIEAAGAGGIHIDDQPYPKPVGYHRGEGRLETLDIVRSRFEVACKARRDSDTLLIARTDALRVTGDIDEVVTRGRALQSAGAEALIVLDLDPAQAGRVREALPDLPLIWIGGVKAPVPSQDDLHKAGFDMALFPFLTVAAMASAVTELWGMFAETGRVSVDEAKLPDMLKLAGRISGLPRAFQIDEEAV
ncbi:isocitrate lyase/PEP mutase family protein [Parvularcula marina]|uniref:isocitrate lyase/PEP mutase family protein n=1 Tax=Parvularcula marina TaxID=2292771 RepID=UPI0013142660|nr:isocitrate lyase/PEP mutase family protein [Parvularcula marina]